MLQHETAATWICASKYEERLKTEVEDFSPFELCVYNYIAEFSGPSWPAQEEVPPDTGIST